MKPVVIEGANAVMHAPAGRAGAGISSLPVRRCYGLLQSAWRPSPEELAALQAGAVVILSVAGAEHPPVALGVAPATSEPAAAPPDESV